MRNKWLAFDPVLAGTAIVVLIAGFVLGFGYAAAVAAVVLVGLPTGSRLWSTFAEEHLHLPPDGTPERKVVLRARRAVRLIADLTGHHGATVLPQRGREIRMETLRVVETVEAFARQSLGIKRVCAELAGAGGSGPGASAKTGLAEVGRELLDRANALSGGIENVAANVARLVVVHETGAFAPDAGLERIAREVDSLRVAVQEAQQFGRTAAALTILEV